MVISTDQLHAKYKYRRRLPHVQWADGAMFVTFCTLGRIVLSERARELIFEHCLRESGILAFAGGDAHATPSTLLPRVRMHAVVVMPDHLHWLLTPLRDSNVWPYPLVDILQCLKSTTAHRINKVLHTSGPVWQEESFDHVLRSEESLKEKADYIRQNPARSGLIAEGERYRWLWVDSELRL